MKSAHAAPAAIFFDRFVSAFATFDGRRVAELFVAPVVTLGSDGSLAALTDPAGVVRYYQAALDRYRREGCRTCRWSDLVATEMGRRALLAAVT